MSASVFPARAGMSPETGARYRVIASVPRASGDEPTYWAILGWFAGCSPRERG